MNEKVQIIYANQASHFLRTAEKSLAKRIVKKLEENIAMNDPLSRAKVLHGDLAGKYRYRIGDYRAIFIIDNNGNMILLTIISIKHRKDIYR